MGQTIVEKILSRHTGKEVSAGDLAIVNVDAAMATDATAPFAIKAFREMKGEKLWNSEKMTFVIDHGAPAPNERIANLHKIIREFATETGSNLYDVGSGICHQIMIDEGHVHPGDLVIGADSHSVTYGAIGAFSTGVGATDLAAIMLTGKTWLKVPPTIRVELNGKPNPGVQSKDIILALVGELGMDGATYKALEYTGSALEHLSLGGRMTIANMGVEMGGKAGVIETTGLKLPYEFEQMLPDPDAHYISHHFLDVAALRPKVSIPHSPANVTDIDEVLGTKIDLVFLGTCTNGRLEDLHTAALILNGKKLAPGVRMIVTPASRQVLNVAMADGTLNILSDAGATFIPPGCGPCVGTHLGVPGDSETILSTANRNFPGRMGNRNARVFLSSPATVAASALQGEITDPADVIEGAVL
jgi:3-isopropylmalate/(R)-2-methylmalate dehydratase large subunit|tara:strand:+ start:20536 stop:21783 length:1248 start_codon:yes stop_codon:yes gene_type:complete